MNVLDWLLASDPSVRYQVLRDLTDASPGEVAAERARIANEGWGGRLLALQLDDGSWAGGACFPGVFEWQTLTEDNQPWTSTLPVLQQLQEIGIDPADERVQRAIAAVKANVTWEHAGQRFFDGEVEPCINGRTVSLGAYFGIDVNPIVERLLGEQMQDGGWNCEQENGAVVGSFHTTINVLEGLLQYETATGASGAVTEARRRGEEYLLERSLFRRKSTGEVIDPRYLQFSWPVRWFYDVLRALDYFRATGNAPGPRVAEAVTEVRSKQRPDGTWLLENTHGGDIPFALEDGDGQPSRWSTLRALRVLRWYDGAAG